MSRLPFMLSAVLAGVAGGFYDEGQRGWAITCALFCLLLIGDGICDEIKELRKP